MLVRSNHRWPRLGLGLSALVSVLALGCEHSEQIQTYVVPKERKAEVAAVSNPVEPTDRMLAAILPAEGQAWFFKAVGPIPEIGRHEQEIRDFFAGLGVGTDGRANWKLPAGWKEEAGNEMRAATIVIPGDKRLEITVNALPWSGTQKDLLMNVNRWRGQLQLPPIGVPQLGEISHEAKAGERPITVVDMRGRFRAGGMAAPFAGKASGPRATGGRTPGSGLPAGHPPLDANESLPAGHPPIDDGVANAAGELAGAEATADVPTFAAPPSWKSVPASGMRKAEFAISDGGKQAQVTLISFPASEGSLIADPLANVNRWRGELGLGPIQKDGLAGAIESIPIDGQPATFAAMIPDAAKPEESKANEATLAAIVKNGDQVWFIKMKGDREVVKKNVDEFKAFLKSVKFSHGGGASNGDK